MYRCNWTMQRRPERRRAVLAVALLLALLVHAAPAWPADGEELAPFEASYAWIWHGAAVAVSTLRLEPGADGTWTYSSDSEPRGLGFLYPMRPRLRSLFRIGDRGVQPLRYHAEDGTSRNTRSADVTFDWNANRATGNYEGTAVDLPIEPGAQDDLSAQIALLNALRHGEIPARISMIDRNTLRDYEYRREGEETLHTKLGEVQTVIYASQHPGSPRITRYWCAPGRGYVPMRVQQKRVDEVEWTMEIQTLKFPQALGSVTPR